MDQLPCGSVLTPAISCTFKFKVHSAHTDSPMAKPLIFKFFRETSLCFTDQETQKENMLGGPTPLWSSTYTSYLLYKVQGPFSPYRQSHGQNTYFYVFLGGPVFASQTKKLRKRTCLVDQLPYGSVLTPALSCTKFKVHSAHADSPMAKTIFSILFEDQSVLHRPRNTGREHAYWTNPLASELS